MKAYTAKSHLIEKKIRIGLASYRYEDLNIEFNLSQIEKALIESKDKVDLLCFGETFLQGFCSLSWNYDIDKNIGIEQDSNTMKRIMQLSIKYKTALLLGYIEKFNDCLYSSCVVIDEGKIIHNYRRISKNWKEYTITDNHYKEGENVNSFIFKDRKIMISLCGDLWIYPERFKNDDILIWPVYVNFNLDEWQNNEEYYAKQANLVCHNTLLVNSITDDPESLGNCFYFHNGKVEKHGHYNEEKVLIVSL